MMVPSYKRRCSAADFANNWLQQQHNKQAQADKQQDQEDYLAGYPAPSDIRTTRDQAVLIGAC